MDIQQRLRIDRVRREAEGYLELGMPAHALGTLQRHGRTVHGDASGCYLMGESLRLLSRYREAIIPLSRCLDLIPDDIHVCISLGWCYKRVGQIDRAIEALERAVDAEPEEALLHYNLACYWCLATDRRKALRYLAEALAIDGNLRDLVKGEADFDVLRGDPLFRSLIR
jgi:tetratricopeptide (TPR) repeat protein